MIDGLAGLWYNQFLERKTMPRPKIIFPPNTIHAIVSGYGAGIGLVDLADEHGYSTTVIRRVLAANRVTIRNRGRRPGQDLRE